MMQDVKNFIPGMFGNNDKEFAIHPLDKEHAIKSLYFAFFNNVALDDFINYCIEYLKSAGCNETHIAKQIIRIKKATFNPYIKNDISSCWLISLGIPHDISVLQGARILNESEVINIVDARKSSQFVVDCIDFYLSSKNFDLYQKMLFQQRKTRASYTDFSKTGLCTDLIIYKSMNFNILGRKVKNVRIIKKEGLNFLSFNEVIYSQIKNLPEQVQESCFRLFRN
jgi:hypothetical protein